jgi:hypothetical protein
VLINTDAKYAYVYSVCDNIHKFNLNFVRSRQKLLLLFISNGKFAIYFTLIILFKSWINARFFGCVSSIVVPHVLNESHVLENTTILIYYHEYERTEQKWVQGYVGREY